MTTPVIPEKDNQLVYAAGDVVVWVGPPNTGCPKGFEDVPDITGASYACGGWVDTSGYIFKLDESIKDIAAAGILTPIRSILTGGTKSVQCNFLEAMNPVPRALFDDVPIFPIEDSPLAPSGTTPPYIASYVIPDPPGDNRYSVIFDSVDGDRALRLYAPFAKVTARGNDQVQQADAEMLDLTFTLYPGVIDDGTDVVDGAVAKRFMNYGMDVSAYFTPATTTRSKKPPQVTRRPARADQPEVTPASAQPAQAVRRDR